MVTAGLLHYRFHIRSVKTGESKIEGGGTDRGGGDRIAEPKEDAELCISPAFVDCFTINNIHAKISPC